MKRYTVRMGLVDGKFKFERMVHLAESESNYTREGVIELRAFPSGEVLMGPVDLGEARRAATKGRSDGATKGREVAA